mgnify:FL=1
MSRKKRNRNRESESSYKVEKGFVFYRRLNEKVNSLGNPTNPFWWKKLEPKARGKLNSFLNTDRQTLKTIVNDVIVQSNSEEKIERQFLKTYFGIRDADLDSTDMNKYIKGINSIMGLKEEFIPYIKLLMSKTKKGSRAPGVAASFNFYINKAINENMAAAISSLKDITDKKILEEKTNEISQNIIINALLEAERATDVVDGEKYQFYQRGIDYLLRSEQLLTQMGSDIGKRYKLPETIKEMVKLQLNDSEIQSEFNKVLNQKDGEYIKTKINEGSIRSIGGFIQEYIQAGMLGSQNIKKDRKSKSMTFKQNLGRVDNIHLYTVDKNIDVDSLVDELNNNLIENSQRKVQKHIERFSRDFLSKANDNFIIYENVKNYSMNNEHGFSGGSPQRISMLNAFTSSQGKGTQKRVEELIYVIYNTINGALMDDKKNQIKEEMTNILSSSIASLLFDDWVQKGKGDNRVHLFNLNGVYVPLSQILRGIGKALQDRNLNSVKKYFTFNYSVPDNIMYPETTQGNVYEKWKEQAKVAREKSTYTIRFLKNFRSILENIIAQV